MTSRYRGAFGVWFSPVRSTLTRALPSFPRDLGKLNHLAETCRRGAIRRCPPSFLDVRIWPSLQTFLERRYRALQAELHCRVASRSRSDFFVPQ